MPVARARCGRGHKLTTHFKVVDASCCCVCACALLLLLLELLLLLQISVSFTRAYIGIADLLISLILVILLRLVGLLLSLLLLLLALLLFLGRSLEVSEFGDAFVGPSQGRST